MNIVENYKLQLAKSEAKKHFFKNFNENTLSDDILFSACAAYAKFVKPVNTLEIEASRSVGSDSCYATLDNKVHIQFTNHENRYHNFSNDNCVRSHCIEYIDYSEQYVFNEYTCCKEYNHDFNALDNIVDKYVERDISNIIDTIHELMLIKTTQR